jgi:hypothetical protein
MHWFILSKSSMRIKMKTLKFILPIIALFALHPTADAQNCQGNKVMVFQGAVRCGCHCRKKCVTPEQLQEYLDNGWNTLGCFNCCWVSNDDGAGAPDFASHDHDGQTPGALTVAFTLPERGDVKIELSDMTGRYVATVADEFFEETEHELVWGEDGVPPGLYVLTIRAGSHLETRVVSLTH